jgi:hypothetical protein
MKEVTFPITTADEMNFIGQFAPFTDKAHVSKLFSVFSELIVHEDYMAGHNSNYHIKSVLNSLLGDMNKEINKKELEELVISGSDEAVDKVAEAKNTVEQYINKIEAFACCVKGMPDIDFDEVYIKLTDIPHWDNSGNRDTRKRFFGRISREGMIEKLHTIYDIRGAEVASGLIYAFAMGDAMNYARIGLGNEGPSGNVEIKRGEEIFTQIIDKLMSKDFDEEKAKMFTRGVRNSLIRSGNYQDAGHVAGALLDPDYILSGYTKEHIAKDESRRIIVHKK